MTKAKALRWLALYFGVVFGAILLRVDYFPFTWVPMYGERSIEPVLYVTVGDLDRRAEGFRATRADGRIEFIGRRELNMPPANFRRLYSERMFNEGPPQHRRERLELAAINRWWYTNLIGPEPAYPGGSYQRQVLASINQTLARRPADPGYVVQIEAEAARVALTRAARDSGNFDVLGQQPMHAIASQAGTWIEYGPTTTDRAKP